MGLTKVKPGANSNITGYSCQTQNSWSYIRFEPVGNQANDITDGRSLLPGASKLPPDKQESFFSRSDQQHELPSYSIGGLDIKWPIDGDQRELISLNILPKGSANKSDEQAKETLVLNELTCRSSATLYQQEQVINNRLTVYLLTLINRTNLTVPATVAKQEMQARQQEEEQQTAKQEMDLAPESSIDHPSGRTATWPTRRRAIESKPAKEQTKETPNDRSIAPSDLIGSAPNLTTNSRPTIANNETHRSHRQHLLHSVSSNFIGPSYMVDLDSIGFKLRSSSLLILAFSSLLVIFVYTLCLLVYLRRSTRRSKCANSSPKQEPGKASGKKPDSNCELDISAPFNLQMPSATRTRLEMMLKSRRKQRAAYKSTTDRVHGQARGSKMNPDELNRSKWTRGELKLLDVSHSATSDDEHLNPKLDKAQWFQQRPFRWTAYGTLTAVRQAAANLTRSSRLHNTRYRPNLNVIMESDLENTDQQTHLKALEVRSFEQTKCSRKEKSYRANVRREQTSGHHRSNQLSQDSYLASLIQDAMSLECTHVFDRSTYNHETLFSRPLEQSKMIFNTNDDGPTTLRTFDPVSRSRILRHVKQQDYDTVQHRDFNC